MSVLDGARCFHPDELGALIPADESKWPAGQVVSYFLDLSTLPASLVARDAALAITRGVTCWPPVCGIRLALAAAAEMSQVIISFANLDPTGRMLGLTQLPEPGIFKLTMRLNSIVPWTMSDLQGVCMHEFGHALGLGHAPMTTAALMNPIYQPQLSAPQQWDVEQAVLRYPGPPVVVVPPTPPPPASVIYHAPAAGDVTITTNLPIPGDYRISVQWLPPGTA